MRMVRILILFGCLAIAAPTFAGNQSVDAALGGAVGGGLGALVGNEIGGRNGAIVGGALGGAAGAAVATEDQHKRSSRYARPYGYVPPGHFCPPGQAKKGRCW